MGLEHFQGPFLHDVEKKIGGEQERGRERWPPQPLSTAEIHSSKHHRVPRGVASCTLPQRLATAGLVIADPVGPTVASAV